jgi:hypothetical protein
MQILSERAFLMNFCWLYNKERKSLTFSSAFKSKLLMSKSMTDSTINFAVIVNLEGREMYHNG